MTVSAQGGAQAVEMPGNARESGFMGTAGVPAVLPGLPRPARAAQAAGGLHRTTRVGGSKSWAGARILLCLDSFLCLDTEKGPATMDGNLIRIPAGQDFPPAGLHQSPSDPQLPRPAGSFFCV